MSKMWETMNDLEMVTSKICSAREILDSAIDAHQAHNYNKTEALIQAADEFLQYYLAEFDDKFKLAWKETVSKEKDDCMPPWGHSDLEYLVKQKEDKVVKWQLPVEVDGLTGECYVHFPDDLLLAANLNEGDEIQWIDNGDGSCTLKKIKDD